MRYLAMGLACLTLGCTTPRPGPAAPDLAVVRGEIDSVWAAYRRAALAGDTEALAQLYAGDPYVIESGLPTIRGDSAFRSTVAGVLAGVRFLDSRITPDRTEFAGDRVLQFGTYRDDLQPTGQPVQVVHGRFVAVFVPDTSGGWKISRLVAVADSTVPQAPPSR